MLSSMGMSEGVKAGKEDIWRSTVRLNGSIVKKAMVSSRKKTDLVMFLSTMPTSSVRGTGFLEKAKELSSR